MKINNNIFDLTNDQVEASKAMYGKIIKCLIAPFHSYAQLEKEIPYTKTTYLFPEREMSASQVSGLISMITHSPSNEEFRIITANNNVIQDMIDSSVRVLTEAGDVVACPCKTFMANIHTIRYDILENKDFMISDAERSCAKDKINLLIKKVQDMNSRTTPTERSNILKEIDMIGEPIIRNKLREMVR